MNIGIFGFGEAGKAIASFCDAVYIKDIDSDSLPRDIDILHVCIPGNTPNFVDLVKEIVDTHRVGYIVNHASTPIGTTEKISKFHERVVHSPIRGVHPHLAEGIRTFVKFVGDEDFELKNALYIAGHFMEIGIPNAMIVRGTRATEALKLWDTTQYGWNIILEKAIHKWCEDNGLSVYFDTIYSLANETYNQGYRELGRPEVVRPYLKHMEGKIGGHCIMQNCELLGGEIAEIIKKYNETI